MPRDSETHLIPVQGFASHGDKKGQAGEHHSYHPKPLLALKVAPTDENTQHVDHNESEDEDDMPARHPEQTCGDRDSPPFVVRIQNLNQDPGQGFNCLFNGTATTEK